MNDLIAINYNSEQPTVLGRDLHEVLEIETPYNKWFARMCEYGFTEGKDFWTFLSESTGGRPGTNHQLTIPMAKEICMIQRSEVGKRYRRYFLSVEEKWNTPEAVMARALQMARSKLEDLKSRNLMFEAQAELDRPKVVFADAVATAKTSILVGELAKLLKQNGVEIGQRRLFDWLRTHGYLMNCGSSRNMPTQRAMELGLFEIKETTIANPDGSVRITKTPKVTGKGQQYFINKFLAV